MRQIITFPSVLLFLLLTFSSPLPLSATDSEAFVTRDGNRLLLNGAAFRFAGANIYWLALDESVTDETGKRITYPSQYRIDDALRTAHEMGANVVRTFMALSVGCDLCIEPTHGDFNEKAFDSMDFAIKQARQYGIRLILPLVDNYHYYHGGKGDYTGWLGLPADSFYSDPTVIADFKQHIEHVINHVNPYTGLAYHDDPTIMAWETGNELQSESDWAYAGWTDEIAQYIKSLAPKQLVGDGHAALTSHNVQLDPASLALDSVDLVSGHYYPLRSGVLNNDAAAATQAGKVFYVGEYDWTDTSRKYAPGTAVDVVRLGDFLNAMETNADIAGDFYWSLFGHDDNAGFVMQKDVYALRFPGLMDGMIERAHALRSHAYAMQGVAVPAYTVPEAPLLDQVHSTDQGIAVKWRGVAGADHYAIERSEDDGANWQVIAAAVTDAQLPYMDASAEPEKIYLYRVQAINGDGAAGNYSDASSSAQLWENGSFEYRNADWLSPNEWVVSAPAAATVVPSSDAHSGRQSALIEISTSDNALSVQLRQSDLPLLQDCDYGVLFWAKSSPARSLEVGLRGNSSRQIEAMTTEWQQYSTTLTAQANDRGALMFDLGSATGKVWLDDVEFTRLDAHCGSVDG